MNVYDFDNTIYRGDSTYDFFWFSVFRHPKTLLYIPRIAFAAFRYYTLHIGTKTGFKEKMYTFLKACDAEKDVEEFWKSRATRIKSFYLDQRRDDDLIISASPEFLLKPVGSIVGFTVIASRVSPVDGKTDGENCYHQEKVSRFSASYPDGKIERFYSDSYSDEPLALLAEKAFIVKGDRIIPWDYEKHKRNIRT